MQKHTRRPTVRDSHILRCSIHLQRHNHPQTRMFPDKPPPTGVGTPQHRHLHPHIHFLRGLLPRRLPPSCTTPENIIHVACFLNGALWSCAVHNLHSCTWKPCTLPCSPASTHTHRVSNTWRFTLRFIPRLTHTCKHTYPSGTGPHTYSPV